MPGGAGADLPVGGTGHPPAGVPGFHAVHAVQVVEDGFEAPEAAAGQRGHLAPGWYIDGSHIALDGSLPALIPSDTTPTSRRDALPRRGVRRPAADFRRRIAA